MELLPLPFIGWFFTIVSIVALGAGALIIIALHRSTDADRGLLARMAWHDMLLFAIWILGLAGGIGVIQLKPWGQWVLDFFCWTLIALTLLSATNRLVAARHQALQEHVNWMSSVAGVLLIVVPVVAICGATIATLRSEAARTAFAR